MKQLYIITAIILISVLPVIGEEADSHLFILSGQSNMAELDPKISFTPTLEAAFGKEKVIVVKSAQGGQPILRWYRKWKTETGNTPGRTGDLYNLLMEKVKAAIKDKQVKTITFVWMQGERDACEGYGKVYAQSLNGLIKQLSVDMGRKDIHFVIGRLSDFGNKNTACPHWTMIREAQVKVAEDNKLGAWVDTDDLNDGINKRGEIIMNDLHYSVEGYRLLGKRLAVKSIELIQHSHQGNG